MSLNGVNTNYQTYETGTYSGTSKKASSKEAEKSTGYSDVAATYEHSSKSADSTTTVNKKASNASVVAQLKADQETRMAQMQSLVTKTVSYTHLTLPTTPYV